jgi:hypothetical protein
VLKEMDFEYPSAALAGAKERSPIPRADTTTNAMRLSIVFVDIYFLSLVASRNFLEAAW